MLDFHISASYCGISSRLQLPGSGQGWACLRSGAGRLGPALGVMRAVEDNFGCCQGAGEAGTGMPGPALGVGGAEEGNLGPALSCQGAAEAGTGMPGPALGVGGGGEGNPRLVTT